MIGLVAVILFIGAWTATAKLHQGDAFRRHLMGFCAAVFAMVCLIFAIGEPPEKPKRTQLTVTGSELSEEFLENEVAAIAKYADADLRVVGTAVRVISGDDVVILLKGTSPAMPVLATLDTGQKQKAARIKMGDTVMMYCFGIAVEKSTPALKYCQFMQ
jgi:tRNA_anti-like